MNADITDQLRAQMAQVQVQVPPGLARQAHRGYRRRRTAVRAAIAGGAAAVIATGTAVAAHGARTSPAIPAAQTAAYVVSHVSSALSDPPLIGFSQTRYIPVSAGAQVNRGPQEWVYGNRSRALFLTPAGKPDEDMGDMATRHGRAGLDVDYTSRTWYRWAYQYKVTKTQQPETTPITPPNVCQGSPLYRFGIGTPSAGDIRSEIEQGLRCGVFKLDGRQRVRGVDTIRLIGDFYGALSPHGKKQLVMVQTLWIDPATFLPLQTRLDTLGHMFQHSPGLTVAIKYITVTFDWLPPTKANLRLLTPPIPAGFRQVSWTG